MKFPKTVTICILVFLLTYCTKSGINRKYDPFYSFRPGKKIIYNIDLNAALSGSLLGIKVAEKISRNLKIIFNCLKYEDDIFKVRVYLKDKGNYTKGIVKDAYKKFIENLNKKNGFVIYLTKKGDFLSWIKRNNKPSPFTFLQKLLIDYLFIPSLYEIDNIKNTKTPSGNIKINLMKKQYEIKAKIKKIEDEIDILWKKDLNIYSSPNLDSLGSIKINQIFSKKLRIIRKSTIVALLKWNLKIKKGIFNIELPVSFRLNASLNLD